MVKVKFEPPKILSQVQIPPTTRVGMSLRHLRRFFEKSSQTPQENVLSVIGSSDLPTELIALIIDDISDKKALACLCRVSKTIKSIAEPLLYGRIDFNSGMNSTHGVYVDTRNILALNKAIKVSNHASMVTDLHLYLQSWQICSKWCSTKPEMLRRCSCNAYDDLIGIFLALLHSLRALQFHCSLCGTSAKNRHSYLEQLKLPYLTRFQFVCSCSSSSSRSSEFIGAAPYLATVTTLSIDWTTEWTMGVRDPGQPISLKKDVMPNVTAMIHNGTAFADSIVLARPISRICRMKSDLFISGYPPSLHHAIKSSPGRLTHLYTSDLLNGLAGFLLESPQPYLHLTSIGTLLFKSYKYTEILDHLSILGILERLESIEVSRGMLSKPPGGSLVCSIPEFRRALSDRHPSLRRILITSRETMASGHLVGTELWEKLVSEWVYRKRPHFSYWEVLNGAYDNIQLLPLIQRSGGPVVTRDASCAMQERLGIDRLSQPAYY